MDKLLELKQTPNAAGQKRNSPVPPRCKSPAKRRRTGGSSPATAQQQKPKRLILADQPLMIAPPNLAFNFNPLPLTQFIDYQH